MLKMLKMLKMEWKWCRNCWVRTYWVDGRCTSCGKSN